MPLPADRLGAQDEDCYPLSMTTHTDKTPQRLGEAACGFRGRITALAPQEAGSSLAAYELENRLLELGFVEGANVSILHEAPFGRDPIAVRVDNMTIAIRRREAMAIMVEEVSA
jgi:ferrous iron transport protein A